MSELLFTGAIDGELFQIVNFPPNQRLPKNTAIIYHDEGYHIVIDDKILDNFYIDRFHARRCLLETLKNKKD